MNSIFRAKLLTMYWNRYKNLNLTYYVATMKSPSNLFIPWIHVFSLNEMRCHTTRFGKILDFPYFTAMMSWWRHYSKTLKVVLETLHGFRLRETHICHFKRTRTQMILKMNTTNWIIYLPMDMCYLWLLKSIFSQSLTPFIGHYNIIYLFILLCWPCFKIIKWMTC